jgi:nicotinamidase-related amidase
LPSEPVLYRHGGSAFSNRTFDRIIREQEDAELVILSLTLSSACLAVAVYAHELGIPVILVEDALSGSAADGLDAIATLGRSMRTPFVQVAAVDGLIEPSRGLRLVHG